MHPDAISDCTAEAFDNFCKLRGGNLINSMLEFVVFVDPPAADMFFRAWKTETLTKEPAALNRIKMMLGPDREIVFRIWKIRRLTIRSRIKAFFLKPVIMTAFAFWLMSEGIFGA